MIHRDSSGGIVCVNTTKQGYTHIFLYGSGCVYDYGLMVNYGKTTHTNYV